MSVSGTTSPLARGAASAQNGRVLGLSSKVLDRDCGFDHLQCARWASGVQSIVEGFAADERVSVFPESA
jgi:hypothetical protein